MPPGHSGALFPFGPGSSALWSTYTIQTMMKPPKIVDLKGLKKRQDIVEANLKNIAAFDRALHDVQETLSRCGWSTGVGLAAWTKLKALVARNVLFAEGEGQEQEAFHAFVRALQEAQELAGSGYIAVGIARDLGGFVGFNAADLKKGGRAAKSAQPLGTINTWIWMAANLCGSLPQLLDCDDDMPDYFRSGALDKNAYL
jgi:hypothetical protein